MSSRKSCIETVSLGTIPATYKSNIKMSSDSKLTQFVTTIKKGPQIVSLVVPPYRHAFLVDVQPTRIMISDWYGKFFDKSHNWKEYFTFLTKLSHHHELPVEFYEVDNAIWKQAIVKHQRFGGGGCAEYIYAWTKKYY